MQRISLLNDLWICLLQFTQSSRIFFAACRSARYLSSSTWSASSCFSFARASPRGTPDAHETWTTVAVYTSTADHFEGADLGKLRAYKFLNNKSTLLKLLPPTEDSFLLHLKRAVLATVSAHVAIPQIPSFAEYWSVDKGKVVPIPSTQPAWPVSMDKLIWCGCVQGCQRKCSCSKKAIPCYIGCRCQGLATKCNRIQTATFESSDSSSGSSDSE